ncbi:MAG: hypothetical protein AB4368_01725 [Xenococcaceae cyanobacterium]
MKLKYIITLVALSFLSLGMVTGCATPDAGQTDVDSGEVDGTGVEPGTEPGTEPDAGN